MGGGRLYFDLIDFCCHIESHSVSGRRSLKIVAAASDVGDCLVRD